MRVRRRERGGRERHLRGGVGGAAHGGRLRDAEVRRRCTCADPAAGGEEQADPMRSRWRR